MRAPWQSPEAPAILGRLSSAVRGALWGLTEDPSDRWHVARTLATVPDRLQGPLFAQYRRLHQRDGAIAANLAMCDVQAAFAHDRLSLAASDWEIVEAAQRRAKACAAMLSDVVMAPAAYVAEKLTRYAQACGVGAPRCETLAGMVARMTDPQWWRRALRRSIVREVEKQAIRFGMVHKRASIYASAEAVGRRAEQKRRNARMLDGTVAENERGDTFTLAELSARNVSNPTIRRAELMTRMKGFEEFAQTAGHVGVFYTVTCPSRMHARHVTGEENSKYDGTTPREAQAYLARTWGKVRAKLARAEIHVYGFRIAEPHHDGTPHWHMLFFMRPQVRDVVDHIIAEYFTEADRHELQGKAAREARFKAIEIDWRRGTAAGYIAKYVAKNIDGFRVGADDEANGGARSDAADTVANVDAWAATWSIRQFQQYGGPGVTIWRELRRVRESPGDLFADAWTAADAGEWRGYVRAMGGIEVKRADRPLQLWKVYADRLTRYHEDAGEVVRGVTHQAAPLFSPLLTRMHEWRIKSRHTTRERATSRQSKAREGESLSHGGGDVPPWTRVNNCSEASGDGKRRRPPD